MKDFHCALHLVFWQQLLNLNLVLDFSQVGVKSVSITVIMAHHSYFKLVILLILHRLGFENTHSDRTV